MTSSEPMAALQLPAVGPFSVLSDAATSSQRWAKWVKSFEYFLVASNVTDKKRQQPMLGKSTAIASGLLRVGQPLDLPLTLLQRKPRLKAFWPSIQQCIMGR